MIKFAKLKEEIEIPCMVCGEPSQMFIVKNMKHTQKNSFYGCEKCFKSFKNDMQAAKVKEYAENNLSKMFNKEKETV